MNPEAADYQDTLLKQQRDLEQIETDRNHFESEILRMQMELVRLQEKKTVWLQWAAVSKKTLKIPLTDEEKKYLPELMARAFVIPADAFKGMGLVEAAEAFLRRNGEPATHRQLLDGLRNGGLESKLRNLDNSVRSAMQRLGKFKWYKDSEGVYRWALQEWITQLPQAVPEATREKPNLSVVGGTEATVKSA